MFNQKNNTGSLISNLKEEKSIGDVEEKKVDDMFSDVDTGDKPSAVQSGKIKPTVQESLPQKEFKPIKNIDISEGGSGILKKVTVSSIVLIVIILLIIVIFSFIKKDNNLEKNTIVPIENKETDNPIIEEPIINEPVVNLSMIDDDSDGLNNQEELELGTDPYNPDTDNDGLYDREEVKVWGTNPLDPDTDNDGLYDGIETSKGFNPLGGGKLPGLEDFDIEEEEEIDTSLLDNDGDGLTNEEEIRYGTDLNNPDTDGDSYLDGEEVANGYDPLDSNGGKL